MPTAAEKAWQPVVAWKAVKNQIKSNKKNKHNKLYKSKTKRIEVLHTIYYGNNYKNIWVNLYKHNNFNTYLKRVNFAECAALTIRKSFFHQYLRPAQKIYNDNKIIKEKESWLKVLMLYNTNILMHEYFIIKIFTLK